MTSKLNMVTRKAASPSNRTCWTRVGCTHCCSLTLLYFGLVFELEPEPEIIFPNLVAVPGEAT